MTSRFFALRDLSNAHGGAGALESGQVADATAEVGRADARPARRRSRRQRACARSSWAILAAGIAPRSHRSLGALLLHQGAARRGGMVVPRRAASWRSRVSAQRSYRRTALARASVRDANFCSSSGAVTARRQCHERVDSCGWKNGDKWHSDEYRRRRYGRRTKSMIVVDTGGVTHEGVALAE